VVTASIPTRLQRERLPFGLRRWLMGGRGGALYWLSPYHVFKDPEGFWALHRDWLFQWHEQRGYPTPKRELGHVRERAFLRRARERGGKRPVGR
jgi:hypothetical protein